MACVFDPSRAMPELINSTIASPKLLLNWTGREKKDEWNFAIRYGIGRFLEYLLVSKIY